MILQFEYKYKKLYKELFNLKYLKISRYFIIP